MTRYFERGVHDILPSMILSGFFGTRFFFPFLFFFFKLNYFLQHTNQAAEAASTACCHLSLSDLIFSSKQSGGKQRQAAALQIRTQPTTHSRGRTGGWSGCGLQQSRRAHTSLYCTLIYTGAERGTTNLSVSRAAPLSCLVRGVRTPRPAHH